VNYGEGEEKILTKKLAKPERRTGGLHFERPDTQTSYMKFFRKWYVVVIMVIVAGSVVWSVLNGMPWLNGLRARWEAQRLQDQWEKPYREDKYGGKTPEETYDMFISALQKGDTTLASKYFVLNKQESWKTTLEQYQKQDLLTKLISEIILNKNSWTLSKNDKSKATYTYNYKVNKPYTEELPLGDGKTQTLIHPAGTFKASVIFEKNSYANIWKIDVL